MTALFEDVAGASLPVAIGLLVLAACAAALRSVPLARRHLEPLCTWCVFAALVNAIAVGAAGELGVVSLGIPLLLCGVAIALRPADEPARAEPVAPPRDTKPAPAAPALTGSLWTDPVENGGTPRQGLWSR